MTHQWISVPTLTPFHSMETRPKPKSPTGETLTNEERVRLNSMRVSMKVTPFEMKLIKSIREVKYGSVDVYMHNGIPTKFDFKDSHYVDPTSDQEILELVVEQNK